MKLRYAPLLLLALGCGNLGEGEGGVVALELRLPDPQAVEPGDTIQLLARALNSSGDSVEANIVWVTPDTAILSVDSSGRLTADSTEGQGRVQARVGNLRSELANFTVRRRSESLVLVAPLAVTVPTTDSASTALKARVLPPLPDTAGISGTSLLYQIVDSATFRDVVHFAGGGQNLRAATSTGGFPTIDVTLRRQSGATFPVTVTVQVSARRPSGAVVPGSGQTFSITFQ